MPLSHQTERKSAINRLESVYPLRQLESQSYIDTVKASREGKPTVWSMAVYWEGDVPLAAMGLNVVYPENYATVLASSGKTEPFLDSADMEGFPNHLCGYARTTLGYASQMVKDNSGNIPPGAPHGGMARPDLLVSSGARCDTRFKFFQALGGYFDAPQWCLELPMMGTFEGTEPDLEQYQVKFMVEQLRKYITFLEKLFGKKMDWAKLEELTDLTVKIHQTTWQTAELCKAIPGPRHSLDFWSTLAPALFTMGDRKVVLKLYQDMLAEVQERIRNNIGGINCPEKYRLIFADIPPYHSLDFFDKLAERGWNFVFESYNSHQPEPPDLTGISDPVEKLARLSRNFFMGGLQQSKEAGLANYNVDIYMRAAREYKADGFFMHHVASCRAMNLHLRTLQDFLQNKMDVPTLWVEGDMVDIRVFNPQETLARAEAFEQTMEYYRKVRRDKGAGW